MYEAAWAEEQSEGRAAQAAWMGEHPVSEEPWDASPLTPQRAAPIESGWHLSTAQDVEKTSQRGSRTPGAEQTAERRAPSGDDDDWALTRAAAAPRTITPKFMDIIDCILGSLS